MTQNHTKYGISTILFLAYMGLAAWDFTNFHTPDDCMITVEAMH